MTLIAAALAGGLVAVESSAPKAAAAITWTETATMPDQPIAVGDLASGFQQIHFLADGTGIGLHNQYLNLPCGTIYNTNAGWGLSQFPTWALSLEAVESQKLLFMSGEPGGSTTATQIGYVSYDPTAYPATTTCGGAPGSANVTANATWTRYIDNPIVSGSTKYTGMGRMAYNATTQKLYVVNGSAGKVFVLDTVTKAWVATISVGTNPWDLVVDSANNRVFVSNRGSNDMSVIDGSTDTVSATVAVGSQPRGITYNALAQKVYVANSAAATITEVDVTAAPTVTQTISTTGNPLGIAVDGVSQYVYYMATNGNIGVIDLQASYHNQLAGEGSYAPLMSNNVALLPGSNKFWALTRNGVDTGMGSFPYSTTVIFRPTIRSAVPTNAVRATSPSYAAYSYQMTATGTANILWSKTTGTLPPGLSVSSSGLISGTPTDYSDGSYTFTIRAYNQTYTGVYREATYTIVVPPHPPQITTTSLASGSVGVAYSATINTHFHPTLSLRSGDLLPAGLTFTNNGNGTATISGTPTAGGTTNFRVEATNSVAPDAYRDYSIQILVAPPVIDTSSIASCAFEDGQTQNWTFWGCVPYLASGSPSATFSITSGSLPSGLSFDASNQGSERIYGTVNDPAGTAYSVTFRATNSLTNLYDEITLSGVIVASAPGQTWGQTYYAYEGVPFALNPKPSPAGTAPVTWSTNGLEPAWTTLNTTTGFLTGTPPSGSAGQSTVFELTAQNAATVARGWPATDYPQIDVTSAPSTTQTINVAAGSTLASTALTLGNGVTGTSFRLPNGAVAPTWLVVDDYNTSDTGALSGTVPSNASGTYTFVIAYFDTNTWNFVGTLVTLNVTVPAPVLSATSTLNLVEGAAYSATVSNTGGTVATWSLSGAPSGWAINSSGVLSGTVPVAGTYTFTVTATNSGGSSSSSYTLTSVAAPVIAPSISAGVFQSGVAMNYQIPASGAQPITWSVVSGLPSWATLTSTGSITGTPTGAGSYSMVISLSNAVGGPVTSTITWSSAVAPAMPGSLSLPTPTVGVPYSYQVPAPTSGTGPFTYSITGSLPAGLSLNSSTGVISGTPTTAGSSSFSVVVSNGITVGTNSATSTVSLTTVVAAPLYSTTLSQHVLVNAAISLTQTYVSGSPATSWALASSSTLPVWLSLNGSTGAITGTAPSSAATATFTVEATNAAGTASIVVTVVVQAAPTMSVSATAPGGSVGSAYSHTVTPSAGTGPFTFAVSAGSLPAGLSLNTSTGLISGTPTAIGSASFTITATNGVGASSTSYSLGISPAVPAAPTVSLTGSGAATLSVVAVAGATSYTLTSSPAGVTCTITAPATSCNVTGLTNGTAYTFSSTATASSLTSASSAASASVTPIANSSAPSATAANGSATVTVATVAGATSYTLTANPGSLSCTVTSPATSCVISGLTNGTAYTFTQTATSGGYTTVASAASSSVTPQVAPPSTPSVTAVLGGTGQASVTVGAVAGATSYVITASPGGATCTVTAPATSCVVTGLTNGTAYTFTAVASNIAGSSAASAASSATTPLAAPSAPVAVATSSGSATITPGTTAGATSYTVTASNGGGTCTVVSPATTCVITGLTNGVAYTFSTTANSASASSSSSVASSSVTTLAAPVAPTVTTTTSGSATVTPGAVVGATSYTVTASNGGGTCTVVSPATTCVITGLTNGTAYTFSTVANNSVATSSASASSASFTPLVAPSGLSAVAGSAGATITIGSPVTGATSYTISASAGGGTCTVLASASPLSCVIAGLTPGNAYTFTAVATAANSTSSTSVATAAFTPTLALPGVPTVTATAANSSITANFQAAAVSLTIGATASVVVTAQPGGATCSATSPATSCQITGLSNGTPYTLTAVASNATGSSVASAATAAVTPQAPPAIPAPSGQLSLPVGQTTASTAGGTVVTVTGANLANAVIMVGNQAVVATVNSTGTQLSFTAPAAPAGQTNVSISVSGAPALNLTLAYANPPVLVQPGAGTGVTPTVQVVAPQSAVSTQTVTLTGSNLSGSTVTVAGIAVNPVVNAAGTSISFNLPTGLQYGTHPVVILSPAGLRVVAQLVFTAPTAVAKPVSRVLFAVGSSVLTNSAKTALKTLVGKYGSKLARISLTGYVAAKPVLATDLALSKARATAVAKFLKSLRIKAAISVTGAGRATTSGIESRRVDVVVTLK